MTALLLCAAPLAARAQAPTVETVSTAESLQGVAAAGRLAAALGDVAALDRLGGGGAAAALMQGLGPRERTLFSLLAGQSVQYVALRGDGGVTAWFNPLEDVWVVGLWTRGEGGWRLGRMAVLDSADLSDDARGAAWTHRASTLAGALAAQGRLGHAIFRDAIASGRSDARLNDLAASRTSLAGVLRRQDAQLEILAAVRRLPGYAGFGRSLESSFVADTDEITGDEVIKRQILSLPRDTRLSLSAVMGFTRRDGESFAVQSPLAPGLIFIVHFAQASPTAEAHPVRIESINLLEVAA